METQRSISKPSIHEIVLVGALTCIPCLVKLVPEYFNGKESNKSINPDEAVTYVAAIQPVLLSGNISEKMQDLLPLMLHLCPWVLGLLVVL